MAGKRPGNDDANRWPTPAEEFGSRPVVIPPEEGRRERDDHVDEEEKETKEVTVFHSDKEPEDDVFVMDITEHSNYIDWSDIRPPNTTERDSSREVLDSSITASSDRDESSLEASQKRERSIFERESTCPIPTCRHRTRKLKHHCWVMHLPVMFRETTGSRLEMDPNFQRSRFRALTLLAAWVCGHGSTVYDLVRWVNSREDFIPNNCAMMARCRPQMDNLTTEMHWFPPLDGIYTMHPVNHPSVLIQWRVLITILAGISPDKRAVFRGLGTYLTQPTYERLLARCVPVEKKTQSKPKYVLGGKGQLSGKSTTLSIRDAREILNRKRPASSQGTDGEKSRRVVPLSQDTDREDSRRVVCTSLQTTTRDGNNNSVAIATGLPLRKAFDSHFHLDRASILIKGDLTLTLEELLDSPLTPPPSKPVEVQGGVLVYCDPDTYPTVFPTDGRFKIVVGLHPKAARFFTQDQFDVIREALTDPRISGLGEIGLDRTCSPATWATQERTLERLLELAQPNKPVVLHVRGEAGDQCSREAYDRCLDIVQRCCEPEQKIHLHSFHGSEGMVREWRRAFPNAYFSFNAMVKDFSVQQREAVVAVPSHRLLLETDAPYLSGRLDIRVNNPRYLGNTALVVAGLRGVSFAEILATTVENGCNLFV